MIFCVCYFFDFFEKVRQIEREFELMDALLVSEKKNRQIEGEFELML